MTAITLPADLSTACAEVAAGRAEIERVRAKLDEARASLARGEGVPLEKAFRQIDAWIAEDEAVARATPIIRS